MLSSVDFRSASVINSTPNILFCLKSAQLLFEILFNFGDRIIHRIVNALVITARNIFLLQSEICLFLGSQFLNLFQKVIYHFFNSLKAINKIVTNAKKTANKAPPHNGDKTNHQDHAITPHSLRPINKTARSEQNPILHLLQFFAGNQRILSADFP
nr:MAG TPA: hypothetical protein [Herelleviridae sp.]